MILTSGDWHGEWDIVMSILKKKDINNCTIVQVGDFGVGFRTIDKEITRLNVLNNFLKINNIQLYVNRGNHDDPAYFTGENKDLIFSNIVLVPDYSIITIENKTIFFIGGAISIDRSQRVEGISYWKEECVVFKEDVLRSIRDINTVITHSSPSFVYPTIKNNLEYWFKVDETLEEELNIERNMLSDMYFILKQNNTIANWQYGHFHQSFSEEYENTNFRLLNVYEFYELR